MKERMRVPRNIGEAERTIENDLEALPAPLQKVWRERFENTPDNELWKFSDKLQALLSKRNDALRKGPELFSDMNHLETDEALITQTLDKILAIENNNELFIGEGKTAHVFRDPNQPNICYKFVHNFTEYAAWNSVDKEAHYLEDLSDLVVDGVHAPRLTSVIDRPDMKVIIMERLDAASIDTVIRNKRKLPEGFDASVFFRRLRAYVAAMHERGIYHRDLHEGNIMIGTDGTPYVIDFGRGTRSIAPEFAYEAYDRAGQNRIVLTSDEQWIDATEALLRAYIAGQPVQLRNS